MRVILLILMIAGAVEIAHAEESKVIDMGIIAHIETGGELAPDQACSFRGCRYGRGRYQVSEVVLEEWNNYHKGERYEVSDLFIPSVNRQVADWYMNVRIPQMLRYYGKDKDSVRLRLVAYNGGIKYALKDEWDWPMESKAYVKGYEVLSQR